MLTSNKSKKRRLFINIISSLEINNRFFNIVLFLKVEFKYFRFNFILKNISIILEKFIFFLFKKIIFVIIRNNRD